MIILQMSGGLGNQMFQYALYKQLLHNGKQVKIDTRTEYAGNNCRNIQLPFFNTEYEEASIEEINRITDSFMDPFHRAKRLVFGRRRIAYHEQGHLLNEEVFTFDTMYLEGCWQSGKYFPDVKEQLLSELILKREYRTRLAKEYLEKIEKTHSVSIHIRRGDYLNPNTMDLYGNICTEAYYKEAIEKIIEQISDVEFFIFTNDIKWAKEHFNSKNITVVDCSREENGYLDMDLMSHCKHNIIANSSFSWWASYLNTNPNKMVIAPKIWLNNRDCSDIYRSGMLVI